MKYEFLYMNDEVWTLELKVTEKMVEWADTGANVLRLSLTQNWCKLNKLSIQM